MWSLRVGVACTKIDRSISNALSAGVPLRTSKAETATPVDERMNDNDILALLKDYISETDKNLHKYEEVDRELGLPLGSAARLIVQAASDWFDVDMKGDTLVRFKEKPLDFGGSVDRSWMDTDY